MTTSTWFGEVENVRHRWGWLVALGISLIILGTIALMLLPFTTVGAALALGVLLIVSGIVEGIHAFRMRGWGGMFLHLIGALLGIFVGGIILTHPVAGALVWTLLAAAFFTVIGIFRLVAAVSLKFPNWGWAVFDGIVTLMLGILLWAEWPWSGIWFLGLTVGVSLILRGWSYVMFAIAVRSLRRPTEISETKQAA